MDEAPLESASGLLGLGRVLRKATPLSLVSVIGSALAVAASFLVARQLGPGAFGEGQFVLLVYVYAGLVRSGIFEGSVRAFIHHRARGEEAEAMRAQNTGVTVETLVSLVPGVLLAGTGLLVQQQLRKVGFLLAPLAVLASSGFTFTSTLWSARDRFDVVARVSLVRAVAGPILVVGLVIAVGAMGIFLAPALADAAALSLYLAARPGLGLRPAVDLARARSLLHVGFPLGASAIVYWAYRLAGSTSIALGASTVVLAFYVFAAGPIAVATRAIAGVQGVLMPAVWTELSHSDRPPSWSGQAERITLAIAVIAGATVGIAQALFGPVALAVVPRFVPSIRLFEVLAPTIFLLPVATIPSLVLDSQRVNRQGRHLLIWTAALVVNITANAVALRLGRGGALAVAFNDVWVQAAVVAVLFRTAAPHIWPGEDGQGFRLYARLGVAAALVVAFTAFHLVAGPGDLASTTLRCIAVALAWSLLGWLLLLRSSRPGGA